MCAADLFLLCGTLETVKLNLACQERTINSVIQEHEVRGNVLVCDVALSFWGGVHPKTGVIMDAHHPQCGESVAGKVLMMPSSRGSCTGSAVLLGLALIGKAPAALVFREAEDVLTLGAIVANTMYEASIAVIRLDQQSYGHLASASASATATATASAPASKPTPELVVVIAKNTIVIGDTAIALHQLDKDALTLTAQDQSRLEGAEGEALQVAMQTLCTMALVQGANRLTGITRAHIDGCIYASPANLTFAQTVMEMGGKVCVPTTMNAISVDYANWRKQGIASEFGNAAQALADAYVSMGAEATFSCAPYLRADRPVADEPIAWAESNAVVYANSVLGARSNKHPDFLDLFMAMTGRAPEVGMYCRAARAPIMAIDVQLPVDADESVWPLLGWMVGQIASDCIPLMRGLSHAQPDDDDLKALCAAFGTTSGAAMLHIQGVTPEAQAFEDFDLPAYKIDRTDIAKAWKALNTNQEPIDLVALGSPHLSLDECVKFATLMQEKSIADGVSVILTVGRDILVDLEANGTLGNLQTMGAQVVPDICWCSISRPLFPPDTKNIITNSGKYAHYGPGLSGCTVLFGSFLDCAKAACTGLPPQGLPDWLS